MRWAIATHMASGTPVPSLTKVHWPPSQRARLCPSAPCLRPPLRTRAEARAASSMLLASKLTEAAGVLASSQRTSRARSPPPRHTRCCAAPFARMAIEYCPLCMPHSDAATRPCTHAQQYHSQQSFACRVICRHPTERALCACNRDGRDNVFYDKCKLIHKKMFFLLTVPINHFQVSQQRIPGPVRVRRGALRVQARGQAPSTWTGVKCLNSPNGSTRTRYWWHAV
jgi:hypothetical protein